MPKTEEKELTSREKILVAIYSQEPERAANMFEHYLNIIEKN